MFRRILHVFALLALILGGAVETLRLHQDSAPITCACGCGERSESPCPCGMPNGPSIPRCPENSGMASLAVAVLAPRQAQESPLADPRREPSPCPPAAAGVAPGALGSCSALGYSTSEYAPPRRTLERLAALAIFRI